MYQKIMVPLDGSELAECVLPHVEAFINQCQIRTIVFVRIIETITPAIAGEYAISMDDLKTRETARKSERTNSRRERHHWRPKSVSAGRQTGSQNLPKNTMSTSYSWRPMAVQGSAGG